MLDGDRWWCCVSIPMWPQDGGRCCVARRRETMSMSTLAVAVEERAVAVELEGRRDGVVTLWLDGGRCVSDDSAIWFAERVVWERKKNEWRGVDWEWWLQLMNKCVTLSQKKCHVIDSISRVHGFRKRNPWTEPKRNGLDRVLPKQHKNLKIQVGPVWIRSGSRVTQTPTHP